MATAFLIVGIGHSARGFGSREGFFTPALANGSMALVVIMEDLESNHASSPPVLLQWVTPMVVTVAGERMRVSCDQRLCDFTCKDRSLLRDALNLLEATEPHGLPLPMDYSLRSLAEERYDKIVGVILLNMNSDGVLGPVIELLEAELRGRGE